VTAAELDRYDANWKAENLAILERAKAMPGSTRVEQMMALAMFARFVECEQVRLKCRYAVLMARVGLHRERH
jgi:hypothetical protein